MFSFLQNSLKASDVKFVPASETIFHGSPTWQMLFGCVNQVICWQACNLLYNWELAVVIYNTQKVYINHKYSSTNHLPRFSQYDMCSPVSNCCLHWYSRHVEHCFTVCSMLAFILTQYTDDLIGSCVSSMPMWLLCTCSRICFCNRQGIIMCSPFIAMWPSTDHTLFQHQQLSIFFCYCFHIFYRFTHRNVYWCADCMYAYNHTQYLLVLVLCAVVASQPISYEQFRTRILQDVYTVLVSAQYNVL